MERGRQHMSRFIRLDRGGFVLWREWVTFKITWIIHLV